MKTHHILFLLLFSFYFGHAQVSNEGTPESWNLELESKKSQVMPGFNLQSLQAEDKATDDRKDRPFRFGYEHNVSLGFEDGKWNTLQNGDKVWLLNIKSKGAKTLNFMFDEFYLPEGAKLYFYNDDKTDLLGAYTSTQNREDMQFGSWLIDGDNVWIEYFEPKNAKFNGQLHISKVVHGYRSVNDIPELRKALNDSAACNEDVDCTIGNDYNDIKDELKKSVAMVIVGSSGFCSGSLINNTENDGRQYFLTANHCLSGSVGSWAFRFNWISPNPSCATSVNSTNGSFNQTASGATLLASNSKSDFALLEINPTFPNDWDLVWAGWDNTGATPDFTVGIHHPRGDIMKVARDNDSPVKDTRPFNGDNNMENWFLNEWEIGVTEPGSSGSALFDQNGRIIGQLAGGAAACNGTVNNGAFDYYGRFDISWDFGSTINSRLKEWLDPNNTGQQILDQYPSAEIFPYDVALVIDDLNEPVCGDEVSPVFRILNKGVENITSATLIYQLGTEPEQSIDWTGNLASGESEIIGSPALNLNLSNRLQATLVINNQEDGFQDNNSIEQRIDNFQNQRFDTDSVTFTLLTDDFASETSWAFFNDAGELLQENQEGLTNNTLYETRLEVEPGRCYELIIFDTAGDGLCCEYGEGSYSVESDTGEIIAQGGEFGVKETIKFRVNEILSTSEFDFNIYPNPANSLIRIDSNLGDPLEILIFDLSGKLIFKKDETENLEINISGFASGVYFMKISSGSQSATKKFIID